MSALIAELAADYSNVQSELLSVHLTKAEHLAVLGSLNRIQAMATFLSPIGWGSSCGAVQGALSHRLV